MMIKPYTRHLILLFVAGFTWGYVLKTIVGSYYYTGWDDPQVVSQEEVIDFSTLEPSQQETLIPPEEEEATVGESR